MGATPISVALPFQSGVNSLFGNDARAPGDRGGTAQAAQGMVVTAPQRIEGFCEQRGEDDPADSGKGGQDRHVVLPIYPRLVLLVLHGSSQGLGHAVHLLVSLGQLPAHESEPLGDASDVSDGGLGGSRRHRDRGLAQPAEHLSGVNTSHAMALQQAGDSFLADAAGLGGRGSELPQFEEPCLGEIAFHGQNLRVVAPELLTHAVYQPGPLGGEIVGDAGPFARRSAEDLAPFRALENAVRDAAQEPSRGSAE